jgi:hypothetical protein
MRKAITSIVVLTVLAIPRIAWASCGHIPTVEEAFPDADIVFTGTVISTDYDGKLATVEVEAIWKGEEIPFEVTVIGVGGLDLLTAATVTSGDRHFEAGVKYIFFPINSANPFEDYACTATTPVTADIEAQLPGLAGGPGVVPLDSPDMQTTGSQRSQASTDLGGLSGWMLAVVVATLAGGLLYAARRRPARVEVEGFRLSQDGDRAAGPD